MRNKSLLFAFAALTVLASSCAEEINGGKSNKKEISLRVETEGGATTKASGSSWSIADDVDLTVGELKLTLTSSASIYAEDPFESHVETKGTIVTEDNIAEKIGTFNLYIPAAEKLQSVTASATNGEWAINPQGGVKPEWPEEGGEIDFYAYTAGVNFSTSSPLTFTYTGSKTTAADQTDLLFTHTKASENDVNIRFYHALSAVRFVVSGLGTNYNVKSIKIKNVANSGTATYAGGTTFNWSNLNGATDYSQSYSENVHEDKAFFDNDEAKCTFFVIPQSVASVKFEIVVSDNIGNEYPIEAKVPALEDGWKAGYFYTYGISGGEGTVDVEVSETFSGTVKSNVKANNTGKMASFIRATVITNWFNSAGKVVCPYTGEIEYNSSNWSLGADGFYYYKKPVKAGESTDNLISSFTPASGSEPQNTGFALHVEMKVIFQSVEFDPEASIAKEAWGSANLPSDLVMTLN